MGNGRAADRLLVALYAALRPGRTTEVPPGLSRLFHQPFAFSMSWWCRRRLTGFPARGALPACGEGSQGCQPVQADYLPEGRAERGRHGERPKLPVREPFHSMIRRSALIFLPDDVDHPAIAMLADAHATAGREPTRIGILQLAR